MTVEESTAAAMDGIDDEITNTGGIAVGEKKASAIISLPGGSLKGEEEVKRLISSLQDSTGRVDRREHVAAFDEKMLDVSEEAMPESRSVNNDNVRVVKLIKNKIVGNRQKKALFIKHGLIQWISTFLADPSADAELKIQSALLLSALSHGIPGLVENVSSDAILALNSAINFENIHLALPSARALRSLLEGTPANFSQSVVEALVATQLSLLFENPATQQFQNIGSAHNMLVEEVIAILAKLASLPQALSSPKSYGLLGKLSRFLSPHYSSKIHMAALECIQAATREIEAAKTFVLGSSGMSLSDGGLEQFSVVLQKLTSFVRSKSPDNRLLSSCCLINLEQAGLIPSATPMTSASAILPSIVRLLDSIRQESNDMEISPMVEEQAPLLFAKIVQHDEKLQIVAMEGGAIEVLAALIQQCTANFPAAPSMMSSTESAGASAGLAPPKPAPASTSSNLKLTGIPPNVISPVRFSNQRRLRLFASTLTALSAITFSNEECRKKIFDLKLIPIMVQAMSDPYPSNVKVAACYCARSLSRSVKSLRTGLVDAGIASPLLALLSDTDQEVQTVASAALVNLVVDFSPLKATIIEQGGIEKLVSLTQAMAESLRYNAVWALKNLLYQADSSVKTKVVEQLTWEGVMRLVSDPVLGVQEQALCVIRNLGCSKKEDISALVNGIGKLKLLELIMSKLALLEDSVVEFMINPPTTAGASSSTSNNKSATTVSPSYSANVLSEIIFQTLYIIVHVSTGSQQHKDIFFEDTMLLARVLQCMDHPKSSIRLAAVWCVVNWIERDDDGVETRIESLQSMGFVDKMQNLLNDPEIDVRHRVRAALDIFQSDA